MIYEHSDKKSPLKGLVVGGQVDIAVQSRLERTRRPIDGTLVKHLLHDPNALVREVCATILGERRSREAIPALLKALSDRSVHVRMDALWAIEKTCGLEVGELAVALLLDMDDWPVVRRRVRAWWQIIRSDSYFR